MGKQPSFICRCMAKVFDYALFYVVLSFGSFFLPVYIEDLYYLYFALSVPLLWIPMEALLFSLWGTTPGKKIFSIRIADHLGRKLPYLLALKRSLCLGIRPGVMRKEALSIGRGCLGVLSGLVLFFVAFFGKEVMELTTGFEKHKTASGWVLYTSPNGEFAVSLPTDPSFESKELPVPAQGKTLSYEEVKSYQSKKVYYSVTYMELPRKWKLAGSSRLLRGVLDVMIENTPGAVLQNKQFAKHQNERALDFHYTVGDEEVQGRLILVGTTLFRLTAVYSPSSAKYLQHDEFIQSFEIKSK